MADHNPTRHKPRIRKTAPTIREKAQAAQAEKESEKPKKSRKVTGAIKKPLKRIRIPSNPVTRALARIWKLVAKILSWLVPRYFINSYKEVRQVTWPGRGETWRLTLAVIIFAAVFGALIAGVDKVIDELFHKLVLK